MKTALYRAGSASKVAYDPTAEFTRMALAADALAPAGRVGRTEGLFCSADLDGLARWFRANSGLREYDATPNALSVNLAAGEPYVYPVMLWSVACCEQDYREYWEAGVPLSQYLAKRESYDSQHIWSDGHEVIVAPQQVLSARRIAPVRLIAAVACERQARDIARLVWPRAQDATLASRIAALRAPLAAAA